MLNTNDPFHNDRDALALIESVRWPTAPCCPHCAHVGPTYDLSRIRRGLRKCRSCGAQFTVRAGTFFANSRIAPYVILRAVFFVYAQGIREPAEVAALLGMSSPALTELVRRMLTKVPPASLQLPNDRTVLEASPASGTVWSEAAYDSRFKAALRALLDAPSVTHEPLPGGASRSSDELEPV